MKVIYGNINKNGQFLPFEEYISLIDYHIRCVECLVLTGWIIQNDKLVCTACNADRNIIVPVELEEDHIFFTIMGKCIKCKDMAPVRLITGNKFTCIDCTDDISITFFCEKCHFEKNGDISFLYDGMSCPACFQL
jgi:hypothetical protein